MSAPDYITAAELQATLGLDAAPAAVLADLQRAVTAASRGLDEMCDRTFYPTEDALEVRSFIPVNPGYCLIDELCEFTLLTAQQSDWVIDQDFYLEPQNAAAQGRPWTAIRTIARPFIFTLAEVSPGWAGFDSRVFVTGKWGWAETPAQIVQAASILAARLFERRKAIFGSMTTGINTGAAIQIGSSDLELQAMIDPFLRKVLV